MTLREFAKQAAEKKRPLRDILKDPKVPLRQTWRGLALGTAGAVGLNALKELKGGGLALRRNLLHSLLIPAGMLADKAIQERYGLWKKAAARKREDCTAKDISDDSVKGVTGGCISIFSLKKAAKRWKNKKKLGDQPTGSMPPGGTVEMPGSDMEASPTGK